MKEENKRKYRILIVDDIPQNIQVLANILKEAGYQMGFAQNGKTALAHTDSTQFDLILLDIMMPEMDGYEVCEHLKRDKKKREIPIIFITARDETTDKTRGFELGAVDYITKPFDVQEVLARVKTHLTIHEYATRLEQMVQERTRQLIHVDRLATLGMFSAAIAHEIKNPLSYIIGNTQFLRLFWGRAKEVLERHIEEDETGRILKDFKNVDKKLEDILSGSNRISGILNYLKSYSSKDDLKRKNMRLIDIVSDAFNIMEHKMMLSNQEVAVNIPPELTINCNRQQISQVFINLIDNACEAIGDEVGKIKISAIHEKDRIHITISDTGPGIPNEIAGKIFDPFFTTKGKEGGTGLGLFIVNSIIEEHNGRIYLTPSHGKGAEFNIIFPAE